MPGELGQSVKKISGGFLALVQFARMKKVLTRCKILNEGSFTLFRLN